MVLVMHDPGGAMMAGMDMALVERWFSKGLAPRAPPQESHSRESHAMHQDKTHEQRSHSEKEEEHTDHQSTQHKEHGGHEQHGHQQGGMDMSMVTPVRPAAAWLALAIGIVLVGMLLLRPAWPVVAALPDPDSARRVGHLLMEKYMLAFEGAGFLILIGIFGAVLLARPSTYPDDPSREGKVAVAEKPEPIADDRLQPCAGSIRAAAHHVHHHPEERGE
jgi:NADH-quinone oxidoreductase subunit J